MDSYVIGFYDQNPFGRRGTSIFANWYQFAAGRRVRELRMRTPHSSRTDVFSSRVATERRHRVLPWCHSLGIRYCDRSTFPRAKTLTAKLEDTRAEIKTTWQKSFALLFWLLWLHSSTNMQAYNNSHSFKESRSTKKRTSMTSRSSKCKWFCSPGVLISAFVSLLFLSHAGMY